MAKDNMKVCPTCGAEIAKNAKVCPHCGAKKPFFKRPMGIILIIVVAAIVIGAVAGGGGSDNSSSDSDSADKKIEYKTYNINDMMKELDENAANADEKYRDQYAEITGKLGTIDSEGDYFEVIPTNDEFAFVGVTCNIQDDSQLDKIKQTKKGSKITVKGQITDVGESLGFYMDVDSIE